MPAPVVGGKGVEFVDHDRFDRAEQPGVVDTGRNQHRLEGFRGGQQQVRRFGLEPPPIGGADISMPDRGPASDQPGQMGEARFEIVEQGLDRTDIKDGKPGPALLQHRREQRQHGGLCLAPRGGGEHQHVRARENGLDGPELHRPQVRPAQRIDDMVLDGGVEAVEGGHGSNSMSSTSVAARARRSAGVSSVSATVSA